MTDWINVKDEMPQLGQKVEYYFSPSSDFVIQSKGTFEGYYTDSEGVEWPSMHIFVSSDKSGFLTGDVTHWKPVMED